MELLVRILELPMGPALLVIGLVGVYYLAQIKRLMSDFPPHRHVGKEILYPKRLAPEKMEENKAASA